LKLKINKTSIKVPRPKSQEDQVVIFKEKIKKKKNRNTKGHSLYQQEKYMTTLSTKWWKDVDASHALLGMPHAYVYFLFLAKYKSVTKLIFFVQSR
jgi:hypothetical protein